LDKTVISISLQRNFDEQAGRPIRITKGDVQAYRFVIRIYDGDLEFPYTTAAIARMVFANEKGLITTNDHGVISAQGITYDVGATEISVPGKVMASIQLLDESGRRLTLSRFLFEVLPDPLDAGQPLPQVPEVEQLLVYIAAVEQALANIYGGVHIGGAYATYEAFIAAHPTGITGDIFLAGATIYVWVTETNEWLNVGQIQGFGIPVDTDTVDFTFVPSTSSLKADVRKQQSITKDENGLKLEGDEATPDDGKFYGLRGENKGFYHALPPGTELEWPTKHLPEGGFLWEDGTAVSRTTYPRLFAALCYNMGTAAISIASPGVVTLNGHSLDDGDSIYFTTTGALPTGLTANTLYFVKYVDTNTFRLAATRGGVAINTAGSQSGVHTLFDCPHGLGDGATTFNVPDRRGAGGVGYKKGDADFGIVGKSGGSKTHTLTTDEMPSHKHLVPTYFYGSGNGARICSSEGVNLTYNAETNSAGGGQAHNILSPYKVTNYIIKI
jgi:microcystin-dependent protein